MEPFLKDTLNLGHNALKDFGRKCGNDSPMFYSANVYATKVHYFFLMSQLIKYLSLLNHLFKSRILMLANIGCFAW